LSPSAAFAFRDAATSLPQRGAPQSLRPSPHLSRRGLNAPPRVAPATIEPTAQRDLRPSSIGVPAQLQRSPEIGPSRHREHAGRRPDGSGRRSGPSPRRHIPPSEDPGASPRRPQGSRPGPNGSRRRAEGPGRDIDPSTKRATKARDAGRRRGGRIPPRRLKLGPRRDDAQSRCRVRGGGEDDQARTVEAAHGDHARTPRSAPSTRHPAASSAWRPGCNMAAASRERE